MDIAMIGLGRMGARMTTRLLRAGHRVVVYDIREEAIRQVEANGAEGARTLEEVAERLEPPRAAWVMVPAGRPTEEAVSALTRVFQSGDIVVDGSNSYYRDSQRRATDLLKKGIHFLDVGVSGGVWGLEEGYGLMVGGDQEAVERLRPVFEALAPAPDRGWGHVGPSGAGHFVKMVHNGIEYGLMQAYAEGFAILRAKQEFGLDLAQVAEMWRHGTVIRSWLLDLTARALAQDQNLEDVAAWVPDSGEGRWTVETAIELAVPAPVITEALFARFRSRRPENYADKLLAVMRREFGEHVVRRK